MWTVSVLTIVAGPPATAALLAVARDAAIGYYKQALGFIDRMTDREKFRTRGGYYTAIGDNEKASHYAGVNTKFVKVLVYALCALLAGLAGLIKATDIKASDANNAGLWLELDAILATVIGGTALTGGRFYLGGSLIGTSVWAVERRAPPSEPLVGGSKVHDRRYRLWDAVSGVEALYGPPGAPPFGIARSYTTGPA